MVVVLTAPARQPALVARASDSASRRGGGQMGERRIDAGDHRQDLLSLSRAARGEEAFASGVKLPFPLEQQADVKVNACSEDAPLVHLLAVAGLFEQGEGPFGPVELAGHDRAEVGRQDAQRCFLEFERIAR